MIKYKSGNHPNSKKNRFKKGDNGWVGRKHTKKSKIKMKQSQKERFAKNPVWNKGKKRSPFSKKWRTNMSEGQQKRVKEGRNNFWKGGITPLNAKIRKSLEFKLWREAVFTRDDWTCQKCGRRNYQGLGKSIILHPHHIKPFAKYPELRFDISNGVTLCKRCHKKTYKNIG